MSPNPNSSSQVVTTLFDMCLESSIFLPLSPPVSPLPPPPSSLPHLHHVQEALPRPHPQEDAVLVDTRVSRPRAVAEGVQVHITVRVSITGMEQKTVLAVVHNYEYRYTILLYRYNTIHYTNCIPLYYIAIQATILSTTLTILVLVKCVQQYFSIYMYLAALNIRAQAHKYST